MARKRKGRPVHGWLAIDKEIDVTSTQIVGQVKRLFGAQKAGHGGTLDPLADGILPIALGEATKTAQWAMDCDKEYVFTICWGSSTDSQDREGTVIAQSDYRPARAEIEAAIPGFLGRIQQVPPKYSAIKVDGARAYDLARDGESFELPSREVDLFEAELIDVPDRDHATFRLVTGKGFYVRAFARDLAHTLGAEGHVSALRRSRVGRFDESNSVTIVQLEALSEDFSALDAKLHPVQSVLETVPQLNIARDEAAAIKQGREIILLPHLVDAWRESKSDDPDDRDALVLFDGIAIALGEVRAGRFRPKRVFQIEAS
ncbi:MAG: tRNA pseudouridine(55) synthase TruB [Pseudomonadota bacterium]